MPPKLKPRKYRLENCSTLCSINQRNLPAGAPDAIHRWIEQGCNAETVKNNAAAMGWEITSRAVFRHKANHLVPEDHLTEFGNEQVVLDTDAPPGKMSDLDILERIIQAGAKQLHGQSVRISPEMTMKAVELRLKLTQGSVMDDFFSAVGKAFAPTDEPSTVPEDTAATATADEQAQGADADPAG